MENESPKKEEVQKETFIQLMKRRPVVASVLLLVIVWMFGGVFFDGGSGSIQSQTSNVERLSIGEGGMLNNNKVKTNCEGGVLIATTKDNYKEFGRTLVSDDRLNYLEMLGNGQIFRVENCTSIELIGGGFTGMEVRILEGEQIDRSGWVDFEFVI